MSQYRDNIKILKKKEYIKLKTKNEVKKIKTVDDLMAYKLGMDVGEYRDNIKIRAKITGLPVDEIFKAYKEAETSNKDTDSIIAEKLGFGKDIERYRTYSQVAAPDGNVKKSVIQLIREDAVSLK